MKWSVKVHKPEGNWNPCLQIQLRLTNEELCKIDPLGIDLRFYVRIFHGFTDQKIYEDCLKEQDTIMVFKGIILDVDGVPLGRQEQGYYSYDFVWEIGTPISFTLPLIPMSDAYDYIKSAKQFVVSVKNELINRIRDAKAIKGFVVEDEGEEDLLL